MTSADPVNSQMLEEFDSLDLYRERRGGAQCVTNSLILHDSRVWPKYRDIAAEDV